MNAYARQVAEELQELRAYVLKNDMADDDFAKREIAEKTASLDALLAQPQAFIVVRSRAGDNFDAYLGFGAAVQSIYRGRFGDVTVLEMPAEHANWQASRLASGLYGTTVCASEEECIAATKDALA